ncbi:hypothetical protein P152DRAFT_170737 [Eremomyces bilateralis CBS 781.70]|uniref:Uncharacterized protein n=1 Tax=Eremomyces bilateralis CBS 781.70 TaxID=1392243 RepID=A0A6G1FTY7_9PEZI|nr:uncharacterized protein P152DRAFT_170737 [Eremomyces bilateralis CBS 781.70]KAF1809139.1 hypothetical protein P152DRAFT_170737 [Eremomyces bilateralis CBS 781.70]
MANLGCYFRCRSRNVYTSRGAFLAVLFHFREPRGYKAFAPVKVFCHHGYKIIGIRTANLTNIFSTAISAWWTLDPRPDRDSTFIISTNTRVGIPYTTAYCCPPGFAAGPWGTEYFRCSSYLTHKTKMISESAPTSRATVNVKPTLWVHDRDILYRGMRANCRPSPQFLGV